MAFKRAKKKKQRFKILLFGAPGTGKTTAALQAPNPAVFDQEEGTNHYSEKFEFVVDDTKDPFQIVPAIEKLALKPAIDLGDGDIFNTKTIVIDPIHVFEQSLEQSYVAMKRKQERDPTYTLSLQDSKVLKFEKRRLMHTLLKVDLNVIVCARTKDIYAPGEVMKKIGIGPDADDQWLGYFDTIIYLYFDKTTSKRMAQVYGKDRTEKLPRNDKGIYIPFEWSYQNLAGYLKELDFEKDSDTSLSQIGLGEELSGRHFETVFLGEHIKTAGVIGETLERITAYYKHPETKEKFIGLLGEAKVPEPYDLTEDMAKDLIAKMEETN